MANCGFGATMRSSLSRPCCSSFITQTPLESSRGKKKRKHPWLDVLRRLTLLLYVSTQSTQLLLSTAHSLRSLSLLLPPSPALSFIWGWCYPADTAGCCLVKNCYGSRGFTIIPCSPKTVIHPSPRAHYYLTCASSSANTKLTAVYKEVHWLCADK